MNRILFAITLATSLLAPMQVLGDLDSNPGCDISVYCVDPGPFYKVEPEAQPEAGGTILFTVNVSDYRVGRSPWILYLMPDQRTQVDMAEFDFCPSTKPCIPGPSIMKYPFVIDMTRMYPIYIAPSQPSAADYNLQFRMKGEPTRFHLAIVEELIPRGPVLISTGPFFFLLRLFINLS